MHVQMNTHIFSNVWNFSKSSEAVQTWRQEKKSEIEYTAVLNS